MPDPTASTICLLDDDPSVLKGLGRLLMSAGWHAEQFSDPEEFLCYATTHRTPVAVIDVRMPLMSGLEVFARLCALSPATRVIVITGHDDRAVRATAMPIGPVAFFVKPFDDKEFLAAVSLALSAT